MKAAGTAATSTCLPVSAAWLIIRIFPRTDSGCWSLKWTVVAGFYRAELFPSRAVATSASLVLPVVPAHQALGPQMVNGCTSLQIPTILIFGASVFLEENLSN